MINIYNDSSHVPPILSTEIAQWVIQCIPEAFRISEISVILVDDEALLLMNQQHLNHDYYTDIITFNLSDDANMLDCELYISLERIIDNAQTQNVSIENEYLRVIAHGLLHLLGYNDKQEKEKEIMRAQEDGWIQQFDRIVSRGTK